MRSTRQSGEVQPPRDCEAMFQHQLDALVNEFKDMRERIALLTLQLHQHTLRVSSSADAPPDVTSREHLLSRLTRREREVALLFSQSACDRTVAKQLGLAVQTVRNQIASILDKLNVQSRDQLLILLLPYTKDSLHRDGTDAPVSDLKRFS